MSNNVYLLLGPEEGEKDLYIQKLIAGIGKRTGARPEIHRYYPFESSLVDILTVLRNGSLFSNSRIVILNDVEEISSAREIRLLAEYCAAPAAESTLLLLSQGFRVSRELDKLVVKSNRVVFWELFENQKIGWIVNYFKKHNMTIDNQATVFLLDMVENNTKQMKSICDKLMLYFGHQEHIRYEDIETLIYHSKEENVFTLFDKIVLKDLPASLAVLQKILLSREAEPVQLVSGLLFQFRKLMALKKLLDRGYQPGEAFSRLEVKGKRVQRVLQEGCRRYSLVELCSILMLVAEVDVEMRSLKSGIHTLVLEYFLYTVIVRGGRRALAG
jgi:DNA polymerase-3 subunit delta